MWQEVISNVALTCVVAIAILLILMVIFLFGLVVSLTFDCWWTLGKFFNIEEEDTTELLCEDGDSRKKPWLLRLKNGKIHNVQAYAADLEMI